MNRRQLKDESKSILNNHFKFWALLVLPFVIIDFIMQMYSYSYNRNININTESSNISQFNMNGNDFLGNSCILVISIIASFLAISILLVSLNAIRGKNEYQSPLTQSTLVISKAKYFWGVVFIAILRFILYMLWSILFIIIGIAVWMLPIETGDKISIDFVVSIALMVVLIIKHLSYSQAFFIYYDGLRNNNPVGFLKSISESRELLKKRLGELFVLRLSFIGWMILGSITCGIAYIWIWPYYSLTMANYYDHLIINKK